jgi:tetratricopeptide (TPR) repeat protein
MKRSWIVSLTALIGLTLLASFIWRRALWGLSAWGAISPLIALATAIIILPQLFLRSAPDPFGRFPRIPSRAARFIAIAAGAALVLWLLRARHELWGERFSLAAALDHGDASATAPLGTLVQWAAYRFMNAIFLTNANSIITFFSIAAGALYAVLAFRAADLLFEEREEAGSRRLAAAVLLSGGSAALFFGFGGNVQIALVGALAFMTEAIRHLRSGRTLMLPAVLLAISILAHLSAAFLVPAFAFLVVRGLRVADSRRRSITAAAVFILCLAAAKVIFVLATKRLGLEQGLTSNLRLIFERPSPSTGVNALLVVGPASVTSVLLLLGNIRSKAPHAPSGLAAGESTFLAVCALSALAAFVIGSPLADGGLTWHLLAVTGPAFAIYSLWGMKRESSGGERFRKAACALFLIGVFQTLPLVIVDAVPGSAERRLMSLALAPGRAEMIVADFSLAGGDLDKARASFLASLARNPKNELADLRLGRIAMKREEYPEAITHFLDAHELNPAAPHDRYELAEALIANRWFPEAISHLETLTVAYPESVAFWRRLGFARNNSSRHESAVAAYEKALALEPRSEDNLRNLVSALLNRAAELQKGKRFDEARALYERVIKMYPRDWRAYNNLAIIEMDQGHTQIAYEILDGALRIHPYESSLHFNMGIVLERLGKNKAALAHMLTARDLDPIYSTAPAHIERLEKKLGTWKPAQPDTQVIPLKKP